MTEEEEIERVNHITARIAKSIDGEFEHIALSALMAVIWTIRDEVDDLELFDDTLQNSVDVIIGIK